MNIDRKGQRYLKDLYTTVIDARWRYTLSFFAFNLLFTWTFFACMWYLQAVLHGDIDYYTRMRQSSDEEKFREENPYTPCVRELYGFISAFLFSLESQHTIG